MIEKLKAIGGAAKSVLYFIVGPIVAVAGYIFYLLSQKRQLQEQVATSKVEKELAGAIEKKEEKAHESGLAVDDYNRIRDEYLRQLGGESADFLLRRDKGSGSGNKEEG